MVITVIRRENPGAAVLLNVLPPKLSREVTGDYVRLWHGDRTHDFRPIWIGQGYPSDVRRALKDLEHDEKAITVITCRRLSRGAKEVLEESGTAWADAAGHAEIVIPSSLYILRSKPTPLRKSATSGVTWSPATEVVAEYILSRRAAMPNDVLNLWDGVDRVAHIAEATRISNAQVSKVLATFDDEGFTAKFGPERGPTSARQYNDASRLLSDWAGYYSRALPKNARAELHVPWRSYEQSIDLAQRQLGNLPWAISGWAAANALAPFTTQVPDLTVYVPEDRFEQAMEHFTDDPDTSEVERGGRIHLRGAGRYLFELAHTTSGLPLVSPVRAYVDLIRNGDRGVEAAERLREVVIGF